MLRRALLLLLLCLSTPLLQGQSPGDIVIFDEDDAIGAGYYDASFGTASRPGSLRLGGPGDKMLIATNSAVSGEHAGLLEWTSYPGESWSLVVARPGFNTADARARSDLVLYLNGPKAIRAISLPSLALESSPPDRQTGAVPLGTYLPEGLDADPTTWQRIKIPLQAFPSGFAFSRLKSVIFREGLSDATDRALWVDNIRITDDRPALSDPSPTCAPTHLVARGGDRSIVLHWEASEGNSVRYHVYRADGLAPPLRLTSRPIATRSFVDFNVTNGRTYLYFVRSVNSDLVESADSPRAAGTARAFGTDDDFLEYLQGTAFDYFWYEANPVTGLVRDRSDPTSDCSVAATGFGLSAACIGIDHGWVSRERGLERVERTLRTLVELPQSDSLTAASGYRGWFYHFLDFKSGLRAGTSELSSIDTALLLAGVLDVRQYFDGKEPVERNVRDLADVLVRRVDWLWMTDAKLSLRHGWRPESGFIENRWVGYNEAMILYLLGLGAPANALSKNAWQTWTSGYQWRTNYGQAFVSFPPLFGHQYSHCWIDFRNVADPYMRERGSTYFENSRRATLAQRAYSIENPLRRIGYGPNVWGLTACDGPGIQPYLAYAARGLAAPLLDDGTIAPTAVGGSLAFAPEYAVPALRFFYDQFRTNIWTGYGFRDSFNLGANWWGPHVLGIDQGPILLMAENLRYGRVWRRFMRNPEIKRGLRAAGFEPVELPMSAAVLKNLESHHE